MSAVIVALPCAEQKSPVLQERKRGGRLPRGVSSIGAARMRREADRLAAADAAATAERVVNQLQEHKEKAKARLQAFEVAARYIPTWTGDAVLTAAHAVLVYEAQQCEKVIQSFDCWLGRGHS